MKYHHLTTFEKHLDKMPSLPLLYLIVTPCPYERKKIVASILQTIQKKEPDIEVHSEEAEPHKIEDLLIRFNSPSLFTQKQAIYLDVIDKLKKSALTPLSQYVENPSLFTYLILGASSVKTLTELCSQAKNELIICDLSVEKPWDRKERLKRFLKDCAGQNGKTFHEEALDHLLEHVGLNLAELEQEVLKLSTYVGEKVHISLKDVKTLCHQTKKATPWQIAESLIWKGGVPVMEPIDLAQLLPLISLLRQQLQFGLSIVECLNQGFAPHDMSRFLPTLKSATLEKIVPIAAAKGGSYFKRGLHLLFEMELSAKNSALDPELLLTMFRAKLNYEK